MSTTATVLIKFWMLLATSVVVPLCFYFVLKIKRAISTVALVMFGLTLVFIAGIDVYLLRTLQLAARGAPFLASSVWFDSELSLALYVMPAMFGGIGVSLVSGFFVRHLERAALDHRSQRTRPSHTPQVRWSARAGNPALSLTHLTSRGGYRPATYSPSQSTRVRAARQLRARRSIRNAAKT